MSIANVVRSLIAALIVSLVAADVHGQSPVRGGGQAQAQQAARPPADGAAPEPTSAQLYLRENYTKYEYKIPMRDGVHLFTAVYVPKDDSTAYPILLTRTPYTVKPYGEDVFPNRRRADGQLRQGEIHFCAARRARAITARKARSCTCGRFWTEQRSPKDIDESTDAYDTIDWLVKHVPNNNGEVGMMGISYPGFYSACGMIDSHPALKCVSPQAPIADWFIGDDFHHNGALLFAARVRFLRDLRAEARRSDARNCQSGSITKRPTATSSI